jgi:hypothetical protein
VNKLDQYRACPKEYESATRYYDPSGEPHEGVCAGCGIERDKHTLLTPEEIEDREAARWQERITPILQKIYDIDGAGCESGDALDVTECEIRQAIRHLQEDVIDVAFAQMRAGLYEEAKKTLREEQGKRLGYGGDR